MDEAIEPMEAMEAMEAWSHRWNVLRVPDPGFTRTQWQEIVADGDKPWEPVGGARLLISQLVGGG